MSSKTASNSSYSQHTSSLSSPSSLSSDSSHSSFHDKSPVFSPKSPLPSTRIPFAWEKLPGIPKKQFSKKNDASSNLLPLPPAGNQLLCRKLVSQEVLIKKYDSESFRKDPFLAALVECSKDHDRAGRLGKISKITRNLSEGFALASISTSCKSACAVSNSTFFIPRSSPNHNIVLRRSDRNSKYGYGAITCKEEEFEQAS